MHADFLTVDFSFVDLDKSVLVIKTNAEESNQILLVLAQTDL